MTTSLSEESGVGRSLEGIPGGQHCQSGEALAEWRSSEQVENGSPSTSLLYWDTDDDDEGAKPSELYGRHTWKIEKFSQINKRELRSTVFEVGGYKWYILIYPQGCDVCNHLSLFLCVANHDKLLPGWSHFAQFTIAVVNKDPKKSKYSDTLHRFWKKEHDWGWKKFMELSKVVDGFIDSDTLIIKAQVQVIREKADRPFRCLDCQYRRELVRVYLSNVEQICRKFVEEKRNKLKELIVDKARWSSFCAFWLRMDQNVRRRMSREKKDVILKVVVKHFFIEKEVTSTLVMDSLYSGLKALEGQSKCNKGGMKLLETEEMPAPIVRVEKDMFVVVDDVLLLLERAAMEPLPPKDEKGPQNRTKDGGSGEDFNKDSIERDERRLTEMGRRTVENFVLAHIFSNKIEVAHQEAVALKRQEELIREEEEACLAGSEQKAKRAASEKEKKAKKKLAKQKRNNRKGKDKGRDEKICAAVLVKQEQEIVANEMKDLTVDETQPVLEKPEFLEDVSDVSDSVDFVAENFQADSEERDPSPVSWDTDTSEVHPPTEASSSGITGLSCVQNGIAERKNSSPMDDSSSTCSTDSVPSVVMNGPYKGNCFSNHKSPKSPTRGKNQRSKVTNGSTSLANETDDQPSGPSDAGNLNDLVSTRAEEYESEAVSPLYEGIKWPAQHAAKPEFVYSRRKDDVGRRPSKEKMGAVPPSSSPTNLSSNTRLKSDSKTTTVVDSVPVNKPSSILRQLSPPSKPDATKKAATPKPTEKPPALQTPGISRPSSAPLIPGPKPPPAPVVLTVHTAPPLARSVSAAGRLGPEPPPASHTYVPQSYRNAIMGSPSSGVSHSPVKPYVPQSHEKMEPNSVNPSFSFGMVDQHQWIQPHREDASTNPSSLHGIHNFDLYKPGPIGSHEQLPVDSSVSTSGRQTVGALADEFPHLDIINDLLNDEHGMGNASNGRLAFRSPNGAHFLNPHYPFPGDMGILGDKSPTSSCRFERTLSYPAMEMGTSGGHFNSFSDYIPQGNQLPYVNGQIDGLVPNQWQLNGSDYSLLSMGTADSDGFLYHVPEYPNPSSGINGYPVFRPSNGQ